MPYTPHTPEEIRQMLDVIGVKSIDDLFAEIPPEMQPRSFDIPEGMSEMEVCARIQRMAAKNRIDLVSYLGAGFYDHHIPKAVDNLVSRGEFYTAYTPYQPEASQGTLQAIFEYQTAVCRLMEMEVANASVYDGGSAIFEAMMMAARATRRSKLVIDEALSPIYRTMLASYTSNLNMELVTVAHNEGRSDKQALMDAVDDKCAAVVVQNPNFFGAVDDFTELFTHARSCNALGVISVYPVMQSVLKTPGEMGADIAVADGQSLGMPLSFGGPYLGIMTCTKKLARQIPGRIAGRTKDVDGKTGYVLTLQAREQHIRRAKATSNICSNQALCALRAIIHMCLTGPEGLVRTAELSMERAHYAADRLTALPGVSLLHDAPFCNEFALRLPVSAYDVVDRLVNHGVVPGFPLGGYYAGMDDVLLVACTEKHSFEQIGIMAELVGGML
ncbi:Glycine dehydrogenase (decarboxylating) [Oleidesulfovibrio alaskensis G20]|jgi:glycine dehydrogenase subunit 1|uniref:Probable glycine dehydrogenase (decarboxylating) subunit 1 n=1 Tax=Oleidesulfovibrio alaskensis (strain ATCC BAA-1058 / DSM 17464 / G20) TaxID=207559 RepID=GCSPA_OLEA2|nr:aminomethyl-transferring glycine dehydrogenase subunit GcvPA [Oleidesulfovibrio alaskensis]Q311A7.1 RecName: Full=Probable glycine dehydrogenase (decarboxylating) subunit 1; AltName: Full=Glycine cleavage system P-protein subunit 1; AltName: Full=Glycine decarboxylase subunit 1; AltName: Full=Glycine dehydrogenase (aminomethyl-transferring) subunit 1 [Oleidesulfovibrio alaskensis G20]ABB38489.1 Glycine dehydrogenase (decarboxylating) [Oleidesulfovibrio alaskensis G20]MBG0773498.1 aminomethyl-